MGGRVAVAFILASSSYAMCILHSPVLGGFDKDSFFFFVFRIDWHNTNIDDNCERQSIPFVHFVIASINKFY